MGSEMKILGMPFFHLYVIPGLFFFGFVLGWSARGWLYKGQ